jgi:hypothetical protein
MGVVLPALCGCHDFSVLDATYPTHCATNCPLHNNEALYYEMLHALLQSFGVVT